MLIVYTQSQVCWMLLVTLRARFAGCWLITYRARSSQSWMLLVEFPQTEVSNFPLTVLRWIRGVIFSKHSEPGWVAGCCSSHTVPGLTTGCWLITHSARSVQSWMLLGEFPRAEASNFHEPKSQEATRVLLQEGCSFLQ